MRTLPLTGKQALPTALRRVVQKGWTTAEAARAAGLPRTTVASRLSRAGVRTRPGANPEVRALFFALLRDHVSPTDAAALVGIARATAYRWMHRAGYTRAGA